MERVEMVIMVMGGVVEVRGVDTGSVVATFTRKMYGAHFQLQAEWFVHGYNNGIIAATRSAR